MTETHTAAAKPAVAKPGVAKPAMKAPRLDPLAVRRRLREEGLRARHSMSQNFLADPDVLQAILDLAATAPGDRILEVGPGLGILTGGLIEAGASVVAVELDRRLAERLATSQAAAIESGGLRVVQGDILDQDVGELIESPFQVVANIPYHITSPILHRFLGVPPRPARLILTVQREVAERISAAPGAMSYLSVFVQFHASVRVAFTVPRVAFEPAPEVESAVVEIRPFDPDGQRPRLEAADEAALWRVVQAGFHERRKMLRNVLARQLPVPGTRLDAVLAACRIDGERRPQTLSVEEWIGLSREIGPLPPAPEAQQPAAARPGRHPDRGPGTGGGRETRGGREARGRRGAKR